MNGASPAYRPRSICRQAQAAGAIREADSDSATRIGEAIDRSLRALMARFTPGLSPAALVAAYLDWAVHLAAYAGKQAQLITKAARKSLRYADFLCGCAQMGQAELCIEPLPQDKRFRRPAGDRPFDALYQGFLLNQQFWYNAHPVTAA